MHCLCLLYCLAVVLQESVVFRKAFDKVMLKRSYPRQLHCAEMRGDAEIPRAVLQRVLADPEAADSVAQSQQSFGPNSRS